VSRLIERVRRRLLANASDSTKEWAAERELARAKRIIGEREVAEVEALDDSEVDAALAHELRVTKRRDPSGYRALVATLPRENQEMIERVEREFGI
jgi:hypothetical protein